MAFITQLPQKYLKKEKKHDLIIFLASLPIPYMSKKYALLEWGTLLAVPLTQEDYISLRRKT